MQSSIWLKEFNASAKHLESKFPPILNTHGKRYDTAVVGAGIVGCTAAYLLKATGKTVALIEGRKVGSGVTSNSTAKLSAQQGPIYSMIAQKHHLDAARTYYDMNREGIDAVQKLVEDLQLPCDFERRSHATWTSDEAKLSVIQTEYNICKDIGIPCNLLGEKELRRELPALVGAKLAVEFPNQAQFNPYKYCHALCDHIQGDGSDVFEESRVTDITQRAPHEITLQANASSIIADEVVVATHLPILDRSMHFAMLEPSRTHCIAFRVGTRKLHNMFISIDQPTRSLRTSQDDSIVVLAGDSMPQGETTDTQRYYADLEEWARNHFDVVEFISSWSAMDYFSGDHIPFMGYLMRGTNSLYTATGFSKWGLANGVAGAILIRDLIQGKENRFAELVDARRWDLSSQLKNIAQENVHVTKHLIGDKFVNLFKSGSINNLAIGEAGIFHVGIHKVGAYHDLDGHVHVIKPVCTHLGCDLVFNQGDVAWDCPCHGSRFDVDGNVLHGPACKNLHKYDDLEW